MSAKRKFSGGFSLVEILVGMTIGLITVLVVMQVLQVAESRRRSSATGADSVVNGSLGLYTIEREGKNAGYGLTAAKETIGCPIVAKHGSTNINIDMVPAKITFGSGTAPDEIRFLASNKSTIAVPMRISQDHPSTAANFFVDSDLGIEDGDLMLAVPATLGAGTWCSVFQHHATGGGGGSSNQALHPPGQSDLNHAGGQAIWPAGGYQAGDSIINLGSFSDRTYKIANNFLQLSNFALSTNTTTTTDLYPNIVQLQAVYGKDTNADNVVDAWNATQPTTSAEWQQVLAIRVALVARSQNREAEIVTLDGDNAASPCAGASPHAAAVCWRPDPTADAVKIDVSSGNANWQYYRYRVLETAIPFRNSIWQQ